jgi:spore maturation protein CgeB
MKLLVVGADSTYAIERFYLKYWREYGSDFQIDFFAAQNIFYDYYNKNILNKIFYKLRFSKIYKRINQLLIERIDFFQPEMIFIFKGMEISPTTLEYAKKRGIKLVNYNPDNPFIFSGSGSGNSNITNSIELYDLHFTYSEEIKEQLIEKCNVPTYILPFGYDIEETVYSSSLAIHEINKVCFIGNPDKFRASLITDLAKRGFSIDVYGHNWHYFVNNKNIQCFNTVSNNELWNTLHKYRVQLNIMRPHNLNSHNMRTFEIPGIGGIQLAPYTKDHQSFFEDNKEIFLYKNLDDCCIKIEYLLLLSTSQTNELRCFARNASIGGKYSYKNRAFHVIEILRSI